jgi:hypothetical protein
MYWMGNRAATATALGRDRQCVAQEVQWTEAREAADHKDVQVIHHDYR